MSSELFKEPPLIPSKESLAKQRRSSGGFVPTIKLLQPGSNECKANPKEYQGGQFLVDDINLSDKFRATVIAQRDHAIRFVKNQKDAETYDIHSSVWEDIKQTKNDYDQGINAIIGTEWLLWLNDFGQFAAFHAGKASTEPLTDDIIRILQTEGTRLVTVFSTLKSWGQKYSALSARAQEIPQSEAGESTIPTQDQLDHTKELFYAPVRAEQTMVEVEETD